MSYDQHITKNHDKEFLAVEDIAWDPWVGKNYNDTKIFVVGMSTYYSADDEKSCWKKTCDNERTPSRQLILDEGIKGSGNKGCFSNTAMMFLEGAKKEHNERMRKVFWESVAFTNFVQEIVIAGRQIWDIEHDLLTQSRNALYAVSNIIKPKLILVWGVSTVSKIYVTNRRYGKEKINRAYPRIIDGVSHVLHNPPPIIGIAHPSAHFSRDKWLKFLSEDPASKEPVKNFVDYLENN